MQAARRTATSQPAATPAVVRISVALSAAALAATVACAVSWAPTAAAATLVALAAAGATVLGVAALRARLHRDARRLQEAIDALPDGFVLYDADDRVALVNSKYRELHADNPLAVERGARFEDVFRSGVARGETPVADNEIEAVVRQRLARHRAPAEAIEQPSHRRWLRISERTLATGGTVGIHADVTALKKAQTAAEKAEKLLRDAVDSISEGFVIYDADDRLVICNQRYKELYPESAAAMVPGSRFADILRAGLARHEYADAVGREDEWLAERLRQHRAGVTALEQRHTDGRWVLITERHTRDGGIAGMRIDVTHLKEVQAEAERARTRMADFAEAATDWFWEADAAGNLTYISEPFEHATGVVAASRLGGLRLDLNRGLDPDNPRWDAHLAEVAAQRPFRDFLITVRFPRGTKHLTVSGKPMFDEQGGFAGYRGTSRDVTAQVDAERALAEEADVLARLIENTPIGISLVGPDGRYRAFNSPYVRMLGLPPDFLRPGDPVEKAVRLMAERGDYGPGDVEAIIRDNVARLGSGRPEQSERTRPDGQIVEVRRVPLPDGGYVTMRVDVTEHRRYERELERANAQLQRQTEILSTLIANLPVAVSLVGSDLRFMAFNRLFLEFFRIPAGVLQVGDSFEKFLLYNAERGDYGAGDIDAMVRERVQAAVAAKPLPFERRLPDGRIVENRRVALPAGGFVTTYIDVSAARRREADLETARAKLEQQTEELTVAAQKVEAANAAKSLFLANMSHELRTPLNAILGFSETMRGGLLGPLDARYQEYADDIHASGSYLLRLINDILDTARIDIGQVTLQADDVDLAELGRECGRLLADRASAGQLELALDLPDGLPTIRADRLRVKQVILNLLSNAVKFTPPGGRVSLSVERPDGGAVVIVVADTGIGMDPADIPLALQPFRQVDNSLARRYQGAGLGLPLSKALVELHGGTLDIASRPGKGTTVRVRLPPRPAVASLAAAR